MSEAKTIHVPANRCVSCPHWKRNAQVEVPPAEAEPTRINLGIIKFTLAPDELDEEWARIHHHRALNHNESGRCRLNPKHVTTHEDHCCSHWSLSVAAYERNARS